MRVVRVQKGMVFVSFRLHSLKNRRRKRPKNLYWMGGGKSAKKLLAVYSPLL